jgi:hypothetical protein
MDAPTLTNSHLLPFRKFLAHELSSTLRYRWSKEYHVADERELLVASVGVVIPVPVTGSPYSTWINGRNQWKAWETNCVIRRQCNLSLYKMREALAKIWPANLEDDFWRTFLKECSVGVQRSTVANFEQSPVKILSTSFLYFRRSSTDHTLEFELQEFLLYIWSGL